MMNRYVYFIVLTVVSLLTCLLTFMLLAGKVYMGLAVNLAISLPASLSLCFIYHLIIKGIRGVAFMKRHPTLRFATDFVVATAVGVSLFFILRLALGASGNWLTSALAFVLWSSLILMGIELYMYQITVGEQKAQILRIEKERATYQFEALKNQVNPHFLFNSLNILASLAYQDADKTNLFAKKLASVYRYVLTTANRKLVTIDEELAFLDSYIILEQIRFADAMQVEINVDDSDRQRLIVPVSLQILVENALKHNVATTESPLKIRLTVANDMVTVSNNLQPRGNVPTNKLGLKNLQQQYKAHGKSITISKSEANFTVTLPLL